MTLQSDRAAYAYNAFVDAITRGAPYAVEAMSYAGNDAPYAYWLHRVNRRCVRAVGMSIWDGPDWLWRDAFDDGTHPSGALSEYLFAMQEDGYDLADVLLEIGTI